MQQFLFVLPYIFLGIGALLFVFLLYKNKENAKFEDLKGVLSWIWSSVSAWLPTPYNIMRLYADSQNNIDNFKKLHSKTAFGAFIMLIVVASFAFLADWEVLYGLEYSSHRDTVYAYWMSMGMAAMIQGALWYSGGMVMKLYLNDMHRSTYLLRLPNNEQKTIDNKDNAVQFKVHAGIAIIGLASTLMLSIMTYWSAQAKGHQASEQQRQENFEVKDSLELKTLEIKAKWDADYVKDSTRIATVYAIKEKHLHTHYENLIAEAKAKYRKGELTKNAYKAQKATLNAEKTELLAPVKDSLHKEQVELHEYYSNAKKQAQSTMLDKHKYVDSLLHAETTSIASATTTNSRTTTGRNLFLNGASILLNFLLLLFARGSNQNTYEVKRMESLLEEEKQRHEQQQQVNEKQKENERLVAWMNIRQQEMAKELENERAEMEMELQQRLQEMENNINSLKNDAVDSENSIGNINNENKETKKTPFKQSFSTKKEENKNNLQQQSREKGGTIQANVKNVFQVLEDKTVQVLYVGTDTSDYKDYDWYRKQYNNRKSKYAKSTKEFAKDNNREWAKLMYNKAMFILAEEQKIGCPKKRKPLPKWNA